MVTDTFQPIQVAIVDIDVHHGNGTEEIVRQLPYADKIFFTSVHIFDSVRFIAAKN